MAKFTAKQVAEYLLAQESEEAGDTISNLKLQKLVYYAQGFHLALCSGPLFSERMEAWPHGPVVPKLYHKYKDYDADAIPKPHGLKMSIYDEDTRGLLDEVWKVYGQFSAWKLRNLTHNEAPWRDAIHKPSRTITHEALKTYFKGRVRS